MQSTERVLSLRQLNQLVASLVQRPETQNVWVTAELLDVAVRGGHCYMELLEKDERGLQVAKARGMIWASQFPRIDAEFRAATGQNFATGLKVMLRVSATMHPVYGFSLTINAVNPSYTLGDMMQRRREIIERLKKEGIIDMNRQLEWPLVPQRIAVISSASAAGYGDFMNQLYTNPSRLRFVTRLYPAIMQGNNAPRSIIAALEQVAADMDMWDGVVILRGGGATSDLQAFEDYELAANVAQFPLPVAIGIGHERDITVLDWVANKRLKTPTAVAEWLVGTGEEVLGYIQNLGAKILQQATDRVSGSRQQLAQAESLLPISVRGVIDRSRNRLSQYAGMLGQVSARRIHPGLTRLEMLRSSLATATQAAVQRQRVRLENIAGLVDALSPMATLRRGYTITTINGHAVKSVAELAKGQAITTAFADGSATSTINNLTQTK